MKVLNYEQVARLGARHKRVLRPAPIRVRKLNRRLETPTLSIVLLDWSCRERFHTLDWLAHQDAPRESYELIWVELHDRVAPEALGKSDTHVTLSQRGMYHKHKGYNVGLLQARGELICVCDSDAVFPVDFVSSVLRAFSDGAGGHRPLVLMHHELRTSQLYPERLNHAAELKDAERWGWWPLHPNAGACMTVRKADATRFGGFDEHRSYRGYLCGPYDLGWRLVNAGIPEIWHDPSVVLWHFAHPDPIGVNGLGSSFKLMLENTYPHVDLHAITAVDALSSGRVMPLEENPEIHAARMRDRVIGTPFEARYSDLTGPNGFSRLDLARLRVSLFADLVGTAIRRQFGPIVWRWSRALLGTKLATRLRSLGRRREAAPPDDSEPQLVGERNEFNIIRFRGKFYAAPQALGHVDFHDPSQRERPEILCCASLAEAHRRVPKAA